MFCDLKKLKIEDMVVRCRATEERVDAKVEQIIDKVGRLLLVQEDWLEKHKHHFQSNQSREGGNIHQGKGKVPH